MRSEQVHCDVCNETMSTGVLVICDPSDPRRVAFVPLEDEGGPDIDKDLTPEHICGEKCALIRLSRALSSPAPQKEAACPSQ